MSLNLNLIELLRCGLENLDQLVDPATSQNEPTQGLHGELASHFLQLLRNLRFCTNQQGGLSVPQCQVDSFGYPLLSRQPQCRSELVTWLGSAPGFFPNGAQGRMAALLEGARIAHVYSLPPLSLSQPAGEASGWTLTQS